MTRDDIIRMAREAGLERYHLPDSMMEYEFDRCIERFAKIVAAAEREECASICFQEGPSIDGELIAAAIRERGEK